MIYAALGVPEFWRHDGQRLSVRLLNGEQYVESNASLAFPDLDLHAFNRHLDAIIVQESLIAENAWWDWLETHKPVR